MKRGTAISIAVATLAAGLGGAAPAFAGTTTGNAPVAPAGSETSAHRSAVAKVACPANGHSSSYGREYNCYVWPAKGAPVYKAGTSAVIGHLHHGTNWVTCVAKGNANPSPPGTHYHSNYWLWTLSDKDKKGHSHWGWAPATYIRGSARPSGPPKC